MMICSLDKATTSKLKKRAQVKSSIEHTTPTNADVISETKLESPEQVCQNDKNELILTCLTDVTYHRHYWLTSGLSFVK